MVERGMTFADYKECLTTGIESRRVMTLLRSRHHQIFTLACNKKALSSNDDKRHILPDGIHTLAHGHYLIKDDSSA